MPSKEEILEGISSQNYELKEIAEFICSGLISENEISQLLSPVAKRRLASIIAQPKTEATTQHKQKNTQVAPANDEDADWKKAVETNTEEAYRLYLSKYISGKYRAEAFDAIELLQSYDTIDTQNSSEFEFRKDIGDLKEELTSSNNPAGIIAKYLKSGHITKSDLLRAIQYDHNWLHIETVQNLMSNNILTGSDLMGLGLTEETVRKIIRWRQNDDEIDSGPVVPIEDACTEFYFWGIPGSGKSCAMGAILSCANQSQEATMVKNTSCQGSAYMDILANAFKIGEYVDFPPRTRTHSISEMSFGMYPHNDPKRYIPITCIDLAGEVLKIMYKKEAGLWCSEYELKVLNSLHTILPQYLDKKLIKHSGGGNRKYHYFVVECGAEDDMQYLQTSAGGNRTRVTQAQLLDKAMGYIKKTNILARATNGIGILLTKADKLQVPHGSSLLNEANAYMERSYRGLIGNIKILLNTNGIAGGRLPIIPFSVGDVWFQQLCKFNDRYANAVIREFLNQQKLPIKKGLEG